MNLFRCLKCDFNQTGCLVNHFPFVLAIPGEEGQSSNLNSWKDLMMMGLHIKCIARCQIKTSEANAHPSNERKQFHTHKVVYDILWWFTRWHILLYLAMECIKIPYKIMNNNKLYNFLGSFRTFQVRTYMWYHMMLESFNQSSRSVWLPLCRHSGDHQTNQSCLP